MIKDSFLQVDFEAQKDNVLTRIDARVKVCISILAIASVICVPGWRFSLIITGISLVSLALLKTPLRIILGRIIPPFFMGIMMFCLISLAYGYHALFHTCVFGIVIKVYQEGVRQGLMVMSRIMASALVMLMLSVSTPLSQIGSSLAWLGMPDVVVEVFMMTYRYLFVLIDEGTRIKDAQTLRLGYPAGKGIWSWQRKMKSLASLAGIIFIRSYDRSEAVYNAMTVRGYRGQVLPIRQNWNGQLTAHLTIGILILTIVIIISI